MFTILVRIVFQSILKDRLTDCQYAVIRSSSLTVFQAWGLECNDGGLCPHVPEAVSQRPVLRTLVCGP